MTEGLFDASSILSSLFEPTGSRGVSPIWPLSTGFIRATPLRGKGMTIMPKKPSQRKNPDHREAVRLSWKSRHIPFGAILIGGLALAGVLSAVFMVLSEGPSNPAF
jgi:hypothetical protein